MMIKACLVMAVVCVAPQAWAQEVDVNGATASQLEALPGIGGKIAAEIVRERDENGPFSGIDDLQARVASVSNGVANKLRGNVRFAQSGTESVIIQEGKVVSNDVVKKVLMRFAAEPTAREVQQQAVEYLRAHPDMIDSWRTRARVNALAPRVTTTAQGTLDDDLRTVTNLDAAAAEIESKTDSATGRLTVGATWDLDRLIFEPQEMAVAREAARTATLRDRALSEVTRRYYDRRRLQVDLELAPPTDLGDRVKKELRLQELTADLDALTGGWFSAQLEKAGRSTY
jgi:hypothetical protein